MSTITTAKMTIPLSRPFVSKEEEGAVLEVLRSGWVSQGPRVTEFERRFADYVGAAQGVAVSSCTTALHLALLAAGIRPGDEVLCPSLSFIATANAIAYTGASPVFVDIDRSTYNIDPALIECSITPRTRGIYLRCCILSWSDRDRRCGVCYRRRIQRTPYWPAACIHGLL